VLLIEGCFIIVYTKEGGYGTIDPDSPAFQLGSRLQEVQALFADLEAGNTPDSAKFKEVLSWYAELAHHTAELRFQYRIMLQVAQGKAIYRES
jgi:hypothetical protein